ncbi:MAG: 4-hydroxy-tetrahydrodipicolinate reductase [Alphaproteobacteria bacterium]|nr:4-hydroxy-tetrahydrodipicolinate reductase [Alphaproteobacteria bacterium]NCQ66521.1 4-hydroxy-tetrahydrodipicolinate reductase [Alphaproteobacteria bacterium]NCT08312.1 4-hydroxy-tetrahydrodipicolinate reductase [Alphaproteobacteria bacterium]
MVCHIGVLGANGRMGQELMKVICEDNETLLSSALVRQGHDLEGKPLGLKNPLYGSALYQSDLSSAFQKADVMIDFTLPTATTGFLGKALEMQTPLVIGTTGLAREDHLLMEILARAVPVVYDTNMSLGITVLNALVEKTAALLGEDFDIEILEMHHRHKKDAPSGTALTLGDFAARGRGVPFDSVASFDCRGEKQTERKPGEIGFAVLRGGGVIGDHSALFTSQEEMLTLSHRALKRAVFAGGAVRAAKWVVTQEPGLYNMRNVLGL